MSKLNQVVEKRLMAINERRDLLMQDWSPYLGAVETYVKENENREVSVNEKRNIAQCLENALLEGGMRQKSKIFETTYADNITFLGVQLPVIAAILPSLVMNNIAVVQALDRRVGSVFYLDLVYGQTKGSLAENAVLIGAKTGHAGSQASRRFATELVYGEAMGVAGSTHYTRTLTYFPVIAGTAVVTDGVETFTDDGAGHMVTDSSTGANGTIVYTTGVVDVTFESATPIAPTIDYQYNYEKATNGVPEVNVDLSSESLTALDFPLRARYTMGAAIDLEKAHGMILEDELIKYLGGEIKFEINKWSPIYRNVNMKKLLNSVDTLKKAIPSQTVKGNYWWRVDREQRFCQCSCGEIFECKVNSLRRFISGHNRKGQKNNDRWYEAIRKSNSGENNPAKRPEVREKISKSLMGIPLSLERRQSIKRALMNNPKIKARGNNGGNRGLITSLEGRNNMSKGAIKRILKNKGQSYTGISGIVMLPRLGTTHHYRSTYEKSALLLIDDCRDVVSVSVESLVIVYKGVDGSIHRYLPDLFVVLNNGLIYLIEVKPKSLLDQKSNILKFEAARAYALKYNMQFQIWTEDILYRNGVTTTFSEVTRKATATIQNG